VEGNDIHCQVVNGGEISNRKGVNVPGVRLSMPYVSPQDRNDLIFGVETGFDFVAASFVRSAKDVLEIREILHQNGGDHILIISKIENAQGVENIEEILQVSDGIMVARGDMGVEIEIELLPGIQKMLIKKAYNAGKIVITATQMLESMIKNPRPTRAEATDVANAIYDGTSAIMLSGETAAGLYPVKAVETMARIAMSTEEQIHYRRRFESSSYDLDDGNVTNAISHAICTTAYDLKATAIITVTLSGRAARNISKYRPEIPIVGCTPSEVTYRQMAMSWGVSPALIPEEDNLDALFEIAVRSGQDLGHVKIGDLVVVSTGVPLGMSGTTNLLKVHIAGDVLVKGHGVGKLSVCGRLCVARSEDEARNRFREGDILVIGRTSNDLMPLLKMASAIVAEEDGQSSHAAIVGGALDIPVIVGAENATQLLKNGTIVTVDAAKGFVSSTAGCPI
jgi:pyruvate kinase